MTTYQFGQEEQNQDRRRLLNQTISGIVSENDCVYFNNTSLVWDKCTNSTPSTQGVYQGDNIVVLSGILDSTLALVTGKLYYMAEPQGGLTTDSGNTKVGVAVSVDKLLVDIDISGRVIPSQGIGGYKIGGRQAVSSNNGLFTLSTVDKFIFSTKTTFSIVSLLSQKKEHSAGLTNKSGSGYCFAGQSASSTSLSEVEKLVFINDSISRINSVVVSGSRNDVGGTESDVVGYVLGDLAQSVTNIEKLSFSNDNIVTLTSKASAVNKYSVSGMRDPNVAGYFHGGNSNNTSVDKILFSNENTSVLATNVTGASAVGTVSSQIAGYKLGSYNATPSVTLSTVAKILFSGESLSNITSTMNASETFYQTTGIHDNLNGYSLNGNGATSLTLRSTIEKITFSSETTEILSTTTSAAESKSNLDGLRQE